MDGRDRRQSDQSDSNVDSHASYSTRLEALSHVFQEVEVKLFDAFRANQKDYNARRREVSYEPGDVVWRHSFIQSNAAV